MARPVLAVMARPLVRGRTKTRLAAHIGADAALAVYRDLLRGTLDQAEQVPGVDLVLATGAAAQVSEPLIRRAGWRGLRQRGEGLGERLGNAFGDVFASGAPAVVALASDSPPIPVDYLRRAVDCARSGRLVLGPAADGGYYLIGCDRAIWTRCETDLRQLLVSSPMSTPRLLAHMLDGATALGLEVWQSPLWIDVDGPEELPVYERLTGQKSPRADARRLREVYVHVTHRCGRSCRHCYDSGPRSHDWELTTTEWLGVIDQCVDLGAESFVVIGGDPLVRRDLCTLIEHITAAHDGRARFFFNSVITRDAAAALAHAGRGRLTPLASVDGPRPVNDALRGPGSYDEVMASIGELLAAGLEPVANTVLVRPVLAGLPQLARELRQAGVRRLHLILPHQQGLRDGLAMVPSGAELLVAVRELLEVAGEIGLLVDNLPGWRRRIGRRNDLCAAGCRDLAVDPYGRVHACVITAGDPAFIAGSVREQTLASIWHESDSLRLLRASRARDRAECRVCPVVDACGGECWVQAHYAARARGEPAGYAAPFPYCDLVRPMLEELGGAVSTPRAGQAAAGMQDYDLFDCI